MRGELLEAERVHSIVGGLFDVYNYFGHGLSEAAYAGALEHERRDRGHVVVRELIVCIYYKGRYVTRQRLDMVIDNRVLVENKATEKLSVGLLLHFGPVPRFERYIDYPKRRGA